MSETKIIIEMLLYGCVIKLNSSLLLKRKKFSLIIIIIIIIM